MSNRTIDLRRTAIAVAAATGLLIATPVLADSETGHGAGMAQGMMGTAGQQSETRPGMPGGYGTGPGTTGGYGPRYGMGPGAMGEYGPGYGMGPGAMGGYGPGYGMGPGMMGGYGAGYGMGWGGHMGGYGPGYGMGPGMMGGYGPGYGMAPGMMGGYGVPYGMGPGMMWGYGSRYGVGGASAFSLSAEQRDKISKIQDDARSKQWKLMAKMREEQARLFDLSNTNAPDDAAMSKSYKKLSELRQQMFDSSLAIRKQMDAVLTKEQRERLRQGAYSGCGY